MKLIRITTFAIIFSVLAFATPALAQNVGPYFSLSIGQSDYDTDISDFDKGTSFSFGIGYSVSQNFALDLSYINFGDAEDGIFPVWTLSADALVASVIGKIPFNQSVSGYGKIGFAKWDAELEDELLGTLGTQDGTDLTLGFGLLFTVNQQLSGFVQYQMFELDAADVDIDNLSIGVQFGF